MQYIHQIETTGMDTVMWSVIRGEAPGSRVADPGVAGIGIPDTVVDWACGYGFDVSDPDVWIGVVLDDQPDLCRAPGEIARIGGVVTSEDGRRIREAMNTV